VEIFQYLDADALVRLRHTSSLANKYVSVTLRRRVYCLFGGRIERYNAFLEWFARTGCVISGEAALHVLFPFHPIPSTIDIYVPEDRVNDCADYLSLCEGFASIHPSQLAGRSARGGGAGGSDQNNLVIALHRAQGHNPLYAITSQLHSGLLNYVTATSFCSAYPILTRNRRALLNPCRLIDLERIPNSLTPEIARWAGSQWTLSQTWLQWAPGLSCNGPRSAGCSVAQRYFQDASCSWGSLDLTGGTFAKSMRETVMWWRGGRTCTAEC
ncbi:hypothetical protein C8Q76DRAFT_588486, partial [Earliella scabrosa]